MSKQLRTSLIFLIVLLTQLSACRRKSAADYFPLIQGAVRIMEITERRITGPDTTTTRETRVVEVVKGLRDIPGLGKVWVVEVPLDSQKSAMFYFQRQGDTVFKFVPGVGGRIERIIYLIQPLTIGKKWFDSEQEREENEVTGCEDVTVPGGTFRQCFRVESHSKRVDFAQTVWFASGLGVVKRIKTQRWTQEDTVRELFRQEELVEYRIIKIKKDK